MKNVHSYHWFLLGLLLLGVGYYSFFQSSYTQDTYTENLLQSYNQLPQNEQFIREIPTSSRDSYLNVKQKGETFGLDNLENGFDSLQIRVWYEEAFDNNTVFVFKYQNSRWNGFFYTGSKVAFLTKLSPPNSGWSDFMKKLLDKKILSLPNSGFGCGFDGIGYSFEIATNRKYRYYNGDKCSEINAAEIIKLIEQEFPSTTLQDQALVNTIIFPTCFALLPLCLGVSELARDFGLNVRRI